jgi:hypothetical protein
MDIEKEVMEGLVISKEEPRTEKIASKPRRTKRFRVMALVVAAVVLAMSFGAVYAATATPTAAATDGTGVMGYGDRIGGRGHGMGGLGTSALAAAVTAGTITQAESDAVSTYLSSDVYAQLVKAGILTQTKSDALKAAATETEAARRTLEMTDRLAAAVTAGTITQTQSDAILAAVATQDERTALAALVTAGTLTQAQSDALVPALGHGGPGGHGGHGRARGDNDGDGPAATTPAVTAAA